MEKNTKIILGVVVVLLILLLGYKQFNVKSTSSQQGGSNDSVKVGILLPLTGEGAVYGEPARNVYQIAVDEINAKNGINGKKIQLIVEDSKCAGKDAANAASKLITVDKVKAIIGGFCSSETLAAEPLATQNKVLLFSPASSSPDLTGKSAFFFRNYPSDASQGKVLADVAFTDKKWKKVAFIQEQKDYPLGIYKAFNARFTELGGTVIKEEFPPESTDFRSQLTKLQAQNPDALFIDTQAAPSADRILKQLQELKWKTPLLVNDIVLGDAPTLQSNAQILEGALGAEFGVDENNEKYKHLSEVYKQKYNADMPYQAYAQTEYDAVYLLKDGIAAVGLDGSKLATWSRTIKDWAGASGMTTIGQDGDRVGGHTPKIVKDGKSALYTK